MGANDPNSLLVSYQALDLAAADIRRQAKALNGDLGAIKSKIASVANLWAGEAREEYNISQQKWDRLATEIHQALNSIAQSVDNAVVQYKAGDKRASANFQI